MASASQDDLMARVAAGRYADKSDSDIAANRAKIAKISPSEGATSWGILKPRSLGNQIYDAVKFGNMAALRRLVDDWFANDVLNWANLDCNGWTPLVTASHYDRLGAVRLLLEAPGVDVNKADKDGNTAVMVAARNGRTEAVRALLAAPGIDLNKADNKGWTAVMHAARWGRREALSLLLAAPAVNVSKRATDGPHKGMTALGLAIGMIKPEAAALLRAAEASALPAPPAPNAPHPPHPAHAPHAPPGPPAPAPVNPYAALFSSRSQVDIAANRAKKVPPAPGWGILKSSIPVGKQIYTAAGEGDMAKLLPLVDEWFANDVLNWAHPDRNGATPLMVGSERGRLEAVHLLLTAPGIDVNKANNDGLTAVMHAAQSGHTEVVRAVLAAPGIDLNKADYRGGTVVIHAALKGHTEVVRALLAAPGIDLNKADTWGRTAVMGAALKGHTEVVRALLAAPGCSLHMLPSSSQTVLDLAIYKNQKQ